MKVLGSRSSWTTCWRRWMFRAAYRWRDAEVIGSGMPPARPIRETLVWMSPVSLPCASAPSATRWVLAVRPPTVW